MAISDASRLADFATGVGTDGTLDVNNINIAGVTTSVNINASGIVTATGGFEGDGSKLTGVSGFATAISSTQGDFLNRVFVTPEVLPLGAGTSITITSTAADGNVAFTRASRVDVGTGSTLHVSVGTTFITNVLSVF